MSIHRPYRTLHLARNLIPCSAVLLHAALAVAQTPPAAPSDAPVAAPPSEAAEAPAPTDAAPTPPDTAPVAASTQPTAAAPPPTVVSKALEAEAKKGRPLAYAGLALSPLTISGLSEIHASDWQVYGTGQAEGRIALPLQKGNTSGQHLGLRLGYRLPPALPLLGEIGIFPGGATLVTLAVGGDIHPLRSDVFSLGVTPKVGYLIGIIDLGSAEVLPGKTPPIVTPRGAFNEGDSVSATVAGPFAQIGASAMLKLFGKLGLRVDAGYQHAFVGDVKIKAGDVELDKDDPALVKADGSVSHANIDADATSKGLFAFAGITYEL